MLKHQAGSAIEPIIESFTLPSEVRSEPLQPPAYKGATNSQPELWQPTEPQFTKAIADHYSVSRKSVQQWFQKIRSACPWLVEADLKLPDDRYTPLCVALMGNYRLSGLPLDAWKTAMWERHPEQVAAFLETQRQSSAVLSALLPESAPLAEPKSAPATPVTVDPGSAIVVRAPELPQTYSLGSLQDITALEFDDPLALADQIVQAVDHVQTAMQQDIDRKQQKLNDTRKAKDLVTAKVQELKLDQRFYQEKNSQISTAQTQDTQALQDLATLLQGLGKPTVAPPAG